MSNWQALNKSCFHCGASLEARPIRNNMLFTLKGAEPMEYRHVNSKEKRCYTVRYARPHDGWGDYALWKAETTEKENV